jgi:Asp-tRNA(Asn)/Glu-tRNA(Gln) amidotransferase A subunit family amidase
VEALASADVHATFGGWLSRADASGALPRVEADGLRAETVQQWCAAFRAVQAWEAWQAHGPWLREHPGSLGADVAERFAIAAGVSDESAAAGRRIVRAARDQLTRWLGDGVIVIPTAPGAAPLRDAPAAAVQAARAATMQMTCLASIVGAPAVSIPVLRSADGLPVGVTLIAGRGCDQALLGLATAATAGGRAGGMAGYADE